MTAAPPDYSDISAILEHAVRQYPDAPAMVFQDAEVSYVTLAAAAHKLQQRFAAQGVGRGSRLGVTLAPSPVFLATLFALARLGACAVPLSAGRPLEQRLEMARKFDIQALIAEQAEQGFMGWPLIQVSDIGVGLEDFQAARAVQVRQAVEPKAELADLPWFVVLSSGTTDNPKGVALTQRQSLTRIRQSALVWNRQTRSIPYEMSIGAGLFPALRTLAVGGTVIVAQDSDFAGGFSSFVQRHQGTHLLLSPWMAAQLVAQLEGQRHAMPSLECLWISGGHCPREVLLALMERVTPHVWLKYASVETGIVAAIPAAQALQTPGLSAIVCDWVQAQVLDEDGAAVSQGQSGLLAFRAEGWPTGYWAEEDNQDQSFKDGWYRSKDYGRLGERGQLFVQGRAEGALNIAGIRVQPEYLEQLLCDKLGIGECAVLDVLLPDHAAALVVVVTQADAAKAVQIQTALAEQLGAMAKVNIRVKTIAQIPRIGLGKIARRALKVQFSTLT